MMKNRVTIGLVLLLLTVCMLSGAWHNAYASALNREQVSGLYTQAVSMFRQANELALTSPERAKALYQKSAMRFERIVNDGGIENGKLYYNIGNAYFRMNDLGMAILNYRRAEMFTPGDANLQHNLQYARSRRLDRIEEEQKTQVLKTLFFWHYDLSPKTRFTLLSIVSALFWATAFARLFYKRPMLLKTLVFSAILAILVAGSLAVEHMSIGNTEPGVIIAPAVTARKGNSDTYEPAFKEPLHAGTEFSLVGESGNWFHIKLMDSRKCWVPKTSALLVRPS